MACEAALPPRRLLGDEPDPTAAIWLQPPFGVFFSLTPAPLPFGGMNSTPAASMAARMAAIASAETETARSLSARLIVGRDRPVVFAMSACERLAKWRAARIWAGVVKSIDT
jgi:hypothetical protein